MLNIGVCSYRDPARLQATVRSIKENSLEPHVMRVFHNPSVAPEENAACREALDFLLDTEDRFFMPDTNRGYAGAVNHFLDGWPASAQAEYLLYSDNDVEVRTTGFDQQMVALLRDNPEVGMVVPGSGHFPMFNGRYWECLWNAGYFWMIRRDVLPHVFIEDKTFGRSKTPGGFDETLGHHEEVDFMIRLRLAGYTIAALPKVDVKHLEYATSTDSEAHKPGGRIHDGVVRWMNKWNRYFCGDALKYSMTEYDPRALRYTDWPPCALYLELWTKAQFPDWNAAPREVKTSVGNMDAVEILKPTGCYKGRAI